MKSMETTVPSHDPMDRALGGYEVYSPLEKENVMDVSVHCPKVMP